MAKKKLATVQLSDDECLFCEKSGILLTNEDPKFDSAVCPEHMMKLLRKWDKREQAVTNGKPEGQAVQ
jgi:hypothetical protein